MTDFQLITDCLINLDLYLYTLPVYLVNGNKQKKWHV